MPAQTSKTGNSSLKVYAREPYHIVIRFRVLLLFFQRALFEDLESCKSYMAVSAKSGALF